MVLIDTKSRLITMNNTPLQLLQKPVFVLIQDIINILFDKSPVVLQQFLEGDRLKTLHVNAGVKNIAAPCYKRIKINVRAV